MKNKKMIKHLVIITAVMGLNVALFQNCSSPSVSFEALKPNAITETELGSGSDSSGSGEKLITEDLGLQRVESKQLDVVWVIDNSGSMSAEAAHVRANYEMIINKMKDNALIKSALISREGTTSTNVSLPAGLDPNLHMQINYGVGSVNGMCIFETTLYSNANYADSCMRRQGLSLDGFYRQSSKKVIIFVTDDNESYTQASTMLNTFKSKFNQDPIVYSFVGLGSSQSPCQARTGTKYIDASNSTNGEVFNICDKDWSPHYSKLVNHVASSIKNTFSLAHSNIKEMVEVKVDDVVVPESDYNISNGLLTIDSSYISDVSARVKIKYIIQ